MDGAGEGTMYQHPLAYLVGLQGLALLRAFCGDYDRAFTLARLGEVRELLDHAERFGDGVEARPMTTREGYGRWAQWYDDPGNELLEIEGPIVRQILDGLPPGVALDAACGTGRHTAYLASLGHPVIGVDSSSEMLAVARRKVPEAEFVEADLHHLPVADDSVDLVVCAIALSHVPDLAPVFAEFVRVLRLGGHLVVSDSRGLIGDIGLPLVRTAPDGAVEYMPIWSRLAGDYLAAALPLGLIVRRCEEVRQVTPIVGDDGVDLHTGLPSPEHEPGEPPDIWALHPVCPAAANAAWLGKPRAIVWHFQLGSGGPAAP